MKSRKGMTLLIIDVKNANYFKSFSGLDFTYKTLISHGLTLSRNWTNQMAKQFTASDLCTYVCVGTHNRFSIDGVTK